MARITLSPKIGFANVTSLVVGDQVVIGDAQRVTGQWYEVGVVIRGTKTQCVITTPSYPDYRVRRHDAYVVGKSHCTVYPLNEQTRAAVADSHLRRQLARFHLIIQQHATPAEINAVCAIAPTMFDHLDGFSKAMLLAQYLREHGTRDEVEAYLALGQRLQEQHAV